MDMSIATEALLVVWRLRMLGWMGRLEHHRPILEPSRYLSS
jgi:hypothetical protein